MVVIDSGLYLITSLNFLSAVRGESLLSDTLTSKSNVPERVGVPFNVPVDDKLSPGGNEPEATDHVYGAVELPTALSFSS